MIPLQVIRRPGGDWEKVVLRDQRGNEIVSKRQKLWHNDHGRRTLTVYGQENLTDWYDLTIHISVWEQELENPSHRHNDIARQTWYPVSKASSPGLVAQLGGEAFDVKTAMVLPPAVKN